MKNKFYIAWFSITLFYLFQYILRVSPSVSISEIRHDFMLKAEQYSFLMALTLYSYSLIQIPCGMLVDKFGVRKIILTAAFTCFCGAIIFPLSHNIYLAYLSRILIGLGAAPSFMCAIKIAVDHLPPKTRGLFVGSSLTIGMLGPIFCGNFFTHLVEAHNWRKASLITFSIIGAISIILCFINVPKQTYYEKNTYQKDSWSILKNPKIYLYSLIAIGIYTPLTILGDSWGTAFLMGKYDFTRPQAGSFASLLYAGMAFGSVIIVWLADKYNKINFSIKISSFILLIAVSFLLYSKIGNTYLLSLILFSIGFFCGAIMLCFSAVAKFTNVHNSGLAIGVLNTLNMLGSAILQHYVGFRLDKNWQNKLDDTGLRIYEINELTDSLSILVILFLICFIVSFILRDAKKAIYEN